MVETIEVTEIVAPTRAELGESPVWDARRQGLFWLDILGRKLFFTDPQSGNTQEAGLGTRINSIAQTRDGGWVAAGGHGFYDLDPDGSLSEFQSLAAGSPGILNDAKCDAAGRLWIGTAVADGAPICSVFSVEGGTAPKPVVRDMSMSNGIGWSPDGKTIYFADSGAQVLYAADFNAETGTVSRQRRFFETSGQAVPDGLSLDQDGNIWLAVWGSGTLVCLSPSGEVLRRLIVPTPRVSSCAFGGPDDRTLFITTACEGATDTERAANPEMGALFRIELDVPGLPVHRFARTG